MGSFPETYIDPSQCSQEMNYQVIFLNYSFPRNVKETKKCRYFIGDLSHYTLINRLCTPANDIEAFPSMHKQNSTRKFFQSHRNLI